MMGMRGRSRGDIPRYGRCRRSEVADGNQRLPAEVAEGCALDKMVDCEVEESRGESREGSRARSCGDETRDHVTELRVRDDGMVV